MRISDWSSDVCSSDLLPEHVSLRDDLRRLLAGRQRRAMFSRGAAVESGPAAVAAGADPAAPGPLAGPQLVPSWSLLPLEAVGYTGPAHPWLPSTAGGGIAALRWEIAFVDHRVSPAPDPVSPLGASPHGGRYGARPLQRRISAERRDRKSTRLNSSH